MLLYLCCYLFFCNQNTAYEMRISDVSSDVGSSDLLPAVLRREHGRIASAQLELYGRDQGVLGAVLLVVVEELLVTHLRIEGEVVARPLAAEQHAAGDRGDAIRLFVVLFGKDVVVVGLVYREPRPEERRVGKGRAET